MLGQRLENVRKKHPLVHNITNYVTANDCANIILACGASPIMADDIGEVEEITSLCDGLNINIGTLNKRTVSAMIAAGEKAALLKHPIVFDPVGAGASVLRMETADQLMEKIPFTVIRGNVSEIKTLAVGSKTTKGVDANIADQINEENINEMVLFAKSAAYSSKAVLVITGAIDIVADSNKAYIIRNGHEIMSRITGTGCMLSAMLCAYLTANVDNPLEAAAAAVCAMGVCGEQAYQRLGDREGTGTFRINLMDEVSLLDGEALERGAKYEIR